PRRGSAGSRSVRHRVHRHRASSARPADVRRCRGRGTRPAWRRPASGAGDDQVSPRPRGTVHGWPGRAAKRVKKVIELAFGEAGGSHVGTGHLLLGILNEGGGLGARVLAQTGVTVDRAREAVSAVLAEGAPKGTRRAVGSSTGMPSTTGVYQAIEGARQSAGKEGAILLRSDPRLGGLVQHDGPAPDLLTLLAAMGTNLEALRRRLKPPRKITQLEAEIWRLRQQKEEATAAGDDQASARLRQRESE